MLEDAWVEDAMAVTLLKNGIALTRRSFTGGKEFKPKNSPEEKKK
ncbi:MAG: hypothetical protein ABJB49_09660 [Nitrospirota bacterium]